MCGLPVLPQLTKQARPLMSGLPALPHHMELEFRSLMSGLRVLLQLTEKARPLMTGLHVLLQFTELGL